VSLTFYGPITIDEWYSSDWIQPTCVFSGAPHGTGAQSLSCGPCSAGSNAVKTGRLTQPIGTWSQSLNQYSDRVRAVFVGNVYHCTWAYWPVQRVAFQIEVKRAQYTSSRVYLPRSPTVFFRTRKLENVRVLRPACTVTLANDASGRAGSYHTPPPSRALWGPCPDGMQMHRT